MFDAQLLMTGPSGETVSVLSPWMSRGGDHMIATLDVVATNLGSMLGEFEVEVFHKDTETTGDGVAATGTPIARDTVGRSSSEFGPLEELVRFKFTISAPSVESSFWAQFRMLSVVWFDAVTA